MYAWIVFFNVPAKLLGSVHYQGDLVPEASVFDLGRLILFLGICTYVSSSQPSYSCDPYIQFMLW